MEKNKSKLLILGTMAYDTIETPFGKTDRTLGGSAVHIALSASNFNVDVGIVSVIGEDFEQKHIELLESKKIDLSGVEVVKGGKTFFWEGKYRNDLNISETLDTKLNVIEHFSPKVPENFRDADIVVLGNLNPNVQMQTLRELNNPKLVILDSMNFWINNFFDDLVNIISEVDVICINDEEARQLSNQYSLLKAANKIFEMGPKYVIIKKGENGALLFSNREIFFAPALPLEEIFDPTGAGDTFLGGFAGYLADTKNISYENMKGGVIQGSNLASFCVEKFGTERLERLTKEEIRKRLRKFNELTQYNKF